MDKPVLVLEPQAMEAFRRTRPWLYLIAITTIVVCVFMAIILIAGFAGRSANPGRADFMIAFAVAGLIIGIPAAGVQMGYAVALSDLMRADQGSLAPAIERACARQRNLWAVTAFAIGLGGLATLVQTLRVLF